MRRSRDRCIVAAAYINRIGTAVPDYDVHDTFIRFVDQFLPDPKSKLLLQRMVKRAEIDHRYSTLEPQDNPELGADRHGFYQTGHFARTATRMAHFEASAATLARRGIEARRGIALQCRENPLLR